MRSALDDLRSGFHFEEQIEGAFRIEMIFGDFLPTAESIFDRREFHLRELRIETRGPRLAAHAEMTLRQDYLAFRGVQQL